VADQLATPEDLASALERDDVSRYKATMLIECATAVIQAITGQRIVQVINDVHTLEFDERDHGRYIDLPEWPVTAVSMVVINTLSILDWTLNQNRLWRPYGWHIPRDGIWAERPYSVIVTYTHGYPVGHQRLQLARNAVLSLLKGVYGNPTGMTRLLIDDYEVWYEAMVTRMDSSPLMVRALKRQYSRPPRSAVLIR
jgi:hypothetical protein